MLGNGRDHVNPVLEPTQCNMWYAKEVRTTLVRGDSYHNDVVHLEMQKSVHLEKHSSDHSAV
jgi:hypothetical protein